MNAIIAEIPDAERNEFDDIWNMTKEDYIVNNTGVQVFIKDQVSSFVTTLGNYINILGNDALRYFDGLTDDDKKQIISIVKDQLLPLLKDKEVRELILAYLKK